MSTRSRRARLTALTSTIALLALACGDSRTPVADGGGVGDASAGPVDIPWLAAGAPTLTPSAERACPDGFLPRRSDTGVLVCLPWTEAGPMDCAGVEAHFPGEAGCAGVGTACPAGDWPEGLPAGARVLYVRARVGVVGRGTIDNPYNTITVALSRAGDGDIIAIARGTYDEQLQPTSDVTLWGACPEETILTNSVVSETATVIGGFFGGRYAARNLTVRAAGAMGIFVQAASAFDIQDVVVDAAAGWAIYVTDLGTSATIENVIVRDVARFPSGGGGIGVQIIEGASGTLRRVASLSKDDTHFVAAMGATVTYERVAGRDAVGGGPDARSGSSMNIQSSMVTIRESAFDRNEGGGILLSGASTVDAWDVALADLGARGVVGNAPGLESRAESTFTARGVHIARANGAAMITGESGMLDVTDAIVMDTTPSPEADGGGLGVSVEGSSTLRLERVLFDGAHRGGIVARDGTTLVATDVTIRNVASSGPRDLGIGASLFGTTTFDRVVIESASLEGLAVSGAVATLDARDIVVRATRTAPSDGFYGRGFEVNLGAHATVDRILVSDNHELGVFSIDEGSVMTLSNAVIERTRAEECMPTCTDTTAYGYGLSVIRGASISLSGFVITDSDLVSVQVAEDGHLMGTHGELRGSPIGVNVQSATFDIATGFDDVTLLDIERNFEGDALPIPQSGFDR